MHGWFQCLRGKARDEYRKRARGRREREQERERKGKYKSSERGKGKETEGEMAKKVTTPDVGSRAKLCM